MAQDLLKVIESLPEPEVLVVGDAILDRYVTGTVGRISPEAPIPVLHHAHEYDKAGGMAAVARNLARLNARVGVAAVVGDDSVLWYENGDGLGTAWVEHEISGSSSGAVSTRCQSGESRCP